MLVKAGQGLIDPCPLWDDDGKVYLVHGWAKSRSGKNNLLQLSQLSADGTCVVDGHGIVIIDENTSGRGFHTLAGPKFYKRGDTYWIFAPINGSRRARRRSTAPTSPRPPVAGDPLATSLVLTAKTIFLRATGTADARCQFAYRVEGGAFRPSGVEFQATAGKWVGAKIGLFTSAAPGTNSSGHADFDFFA